MLGSVTDQQHALIITIHARIQKVLSEGVQIW